LGSVGLHGIAWARGIIARVGCEVEALLHRADADRDCSGFGAPGTLDRSGPSVDGSGLESIQGAALRETLDLWERVDALGKWECEAHRAAQARVGPETRREERADGQAPALHALVFTPASQLPPDHADYSENGDPGTEWEGGTGGASTLAVPLGTDLRLPSGSGQAWVTAVVAIARGQQLVGSVRSGRGTASSGAWGAQEEGIAEALGTVREQVREALREIEVLAPETENRGYRREWPTPARIRRNRGEVAAHLRAAFRELWERAGGAEAHGGPTERADGDGEPATWSLP